MGKAISVIFMLMGVVFAGIGAGQAISQHTKIQTYVPVQATVTSKHIARHVSRNNKGRTSVTYEPVIHYVYKVNGRSYSNDQVLPINLSSSLAWAQEIVDSYTVRATTEAYYNPSSPTRSFLMKKYIFFPYIFILFPMIFICIGLFFLVAGGSPERDPKAPAVTSSSLYKLLPSSSIPKRIMGTSAVAALWIIGCGGPLLHYYSYANAPYGTTATISTTVAAIIATALIAIVLKNITLQRNIEEPSIFIRNSHFKSGDTIRLTIRQNLKKQLLVESAKVGLIAERVERRRVGNKSNIKKTISFQHWITLVENYNATPQMPLSYTPDLTIPTDQPSSTPPKQKGYPRHQWRLEYHLSLAKSPDLKTKFPINVANAPASFAPYTPPKET